MDIFGAILGLASTIFAPYLAPLVGISTTAFTLGGLSLYAAYSMHEARKQARRQQDAARASIADRLITTRSSAAPANIIYGRTRVAASTIAYITNHGAQREYVTMVLPICTIPLAESLPLSFDEETL